MRHPFYTLLCLPLFFSCNKKEEASPAAHESEPAAAVVIPVQADAVPEEESSELQPWEDRALRELLIAHNDASLHTGSAEEEIAYFADVVDYFDEGKISRDKVLADLARYANRWDKRRHFEIRSDDQGIKPSKSGPGLYRAEVVKDYALETSKGKKAKGTIRNIFVIQRTGSGPEARFKIISMKETRG